MSTSEGDCFRGDNFFAVPLNLTHWNCYRDIYCNAESMQFVAPARTLAQAQEDFERALWFGRNQPRRHQLYAVSFAGHENAGALCGYQWRGAGVFELGLMILPLWQGQGHAAQVLKALELHLSLRFTVEVFSLHFSINHQAMRQVANRLAYAIKPSQVGRTCFATKSCTARR